MSDSWCRRSEVAALNVGDVSYQNDGTARRRIAKSKTDQAGEGALVFVSRKGARALERWIAELDTCGDTPLFVGLGNRSKGKRLSGHSISAVLKARTGRKDVSGHSCRVAGAQAASEADMGLAAIMAAGRWTSTRMVRRYAQAADAGRNAAAQLAAKHGR